MTNPKPLVLPRSERFIIAHRLDPNSFLVELGVTISYTMRIPPTFDVLHLVTGTESDTLCSDDAQEALLVYNSIVQGEQ